jgi:Arc/MetJ-type ribon-helix-helix transcriptional regulator
MIRLPVHRSGAAGMSPIKNRHPGYMTKLLVLRLPDRLVSEVDRLIAEGRYSSRTEAVRVALDQLLNELKHQQIDMTIADGYRRVPDAPADAWVEVSTHALVAEDPRW